MSKKNKKLKLDKPLELLGDYAWRAASYEVGAARGIPHRVRETWNTNTFMRVACGELGITPVSGRQFELHIARLWIARDLHAIMRIALQVCRE